MRLVLNKQKRCLKQTTVLSETLPKFKQYEIKMKIKTFTHSTIVFQCRFGKYKMEPVY